jgi:hypothetical protein
LTKEMGLTEEAIVVGDLASDTKRDCRCDVLFFFFFLFKVCRKNKIAWLGIWLVRRREIADVIFWFFFFFL